MLWRGLGWLLGGIAHEQGGVDGAISEGVSAEATLFAEMPAVIAPEHDDDVITGGAVVFVVTVDVGQDSGQLGGARRAARRPTPVRVYTSSPIK